jgi:hypothetical protein
VERARRQEASGCLELPTPPCQRRHWMCARVPTSASLALHQTWNAVLSADGGELHREWPDLDSPSTAFGGGNSRLEWLMDPSPSILPAARSPLHDDPTISYFAAAFPQSTCLASIHHAAHSSHVAGPDLGAHRFRWRLRFCKSPTKLPRLHLKRHSWEPLAACGRAI